MAQRTSAAPTKPEDCPTAWFAVLERARLDGDEARAAEAIRQLNRLGVVVHWQEPVLCHQ